MWTVRHSPFAGRRGSGPASEMRSSRALGPGSTDTSRWMDGVACEPGRLVVPMNERTFSDRTVGKWLAWRDFWPSRNSTKLWRLLDTATPLRHDPDAERRAPSLRMQVPVVHLITDRRLAPDLAARASAALEALPPGTCAIHLREKDLGGRALLDLARALATVCHARGSASS